MCKTWIKIVYIYRGIWCHTRTCVKTLRSANPWMNVPKWSKLQRISPCSGSREQWTLCREHVNRNTVHAWSVISLLIILTSWLSESGVLTKRDMQNMQSGGGGREDWNWVCFLKPASAPDAQHKNSTSLIDPCEACSEWKPSWKPSVWPWPLYCNSVPGCYQTSYSLGHLCGEQQF